MGKNWYVNPMKEEVPQEEIIDRGDSGEFHSWNYEAFDTKENGYEDIMEKLKGYRKMYAAAGSPEKEKEIVEEVLKIYRDRDVFPIQYYSDQGIISEIEKCIAYKASFEGDTVSCVSGDTEFFNGKQWKRIDQYEQGKDKVLQYNLDGTSELVFPTRYISKNGYFSAYQYEDNILNCVQTGDHDCVVISKVAPEFSECVGKHTDEGLNVYKIKQKFLADSEKPFKVIGNTRYAGESFKPDYNVMSYVSACEMSGEDFDERLLSMPMEDRLRIMNKLLEIGGCKLNGESCFRYNSGTRQHRDFFASLAFLSGYNVICGERYVTVSEFSEYHWCVPNDFREVTLEGKYCFEVPSHMLVLRHDGVPYITGNCGAGVGTTLCDYLFPNLYDTPSKHDVNKVGAETLYAKFYNDDYLRRAIKFCFSYKDGRPVPTSVMGGLRLVGSAPTNFRPMNAKAVYERFCPKGGVIYDYCCVSGDTEFFTGDGWKPIKDYTDGDKVLQFRGDGRAELVDPVEYIHYQSSAPFYKYESENLCSCLTGNHDIVYKDNGKYCKIKQDEIVYRYFSHEIPVVFRCSLENSKRINVDLYKLAFLAYFRGKLSGERTIMVQFSGEEELLKIVSLLNKVQFKVRKYNTSYYFESNDSYDGCVVFDWDFKEILEVNDEQLDGGLFRFKAECLKELYHVQENTVHDIAKWIKYWGSYEQEEHTCIDVDKDLMDVAQLLFSMTGFVTITGYNHGCGRHVLIFGNSNGAWYNREDGYTEVEEADKYCFVVSSHMLILRYKGRVFITGNCGFGGRMLGALSSKNNYRYVGTDPNVETMYHLNQLGEYIEEVTGREDSYELHCCGSEVFKGKPNSIDFAFSSPPYFDLEVYSDDPTQCYNKFPVLEDWLEGYVRQTIKNIIYMLKPGRVYAVNIADFKVGGGGECAYVDEWIRISKEEGAPLFDNVYLGVTARAGSKEQAAGELKKENILIFKKPL